MIYTIKLMADAKVTQSLDVTANSVQEAQSKAIAFARNGGGIWEVGDDIDEDSIQVE